MSLLLRPSLVGFLVSKLFSAVLLHMACVATIMTNGLLSLGAILPAVLPFLLGPFSFAF